MPISADFTIDTTNYRVTHSSGTTVYSANALYSYLENVFSGSGYMQFKPPMSANTPTDYNFVNGWFIDEPSLQYINGGGLKTVGWDNTVYNTSSPQGVYLLNFASSGYTSAVSGDLGKTVTASGNSGTLLAYDNTARNWWVRGNSGSWASALGVTITSGTGAGTMSAAATTGESLFSNVYTLGSPLQTGTQLYIQQGTNTLIPSYWSTGHIDLCLVIKRLGTTLNSGNVTIFAREFGNTFNYFTTSLSGGGRTPVPISTSVDTSIVDSSGTISGFTGITLTYGTVSKNLNNGNGAKNYDLVISQAVPGTYTVQQMYEYLQYITERGMTSTSLTNGTQGQLFLGLTGYTPIAAAPFGTFAGGKFFGAQGVWLDTASLKTTDLQNYQLIADDGSSQIPPNIVSVAVNSVVSGDRVFVARTSSGLVNTAQYTLASGNNSGNGTVVISGSISSDDPPSGWVRIFNTSTKLFDLYPYSSWSGSTFTLNATTLSASYSAGTNAFVPLIDTTAGSTTASNSLIYASSIPVIVRVRKYGGAGASILPYESTGTVTSAGLSVSAIRSNDAIVS